jgi:hypothetical protein
VKLLTNAIVALFALMLIVSITRLAYAPGPAINLPPGTFDAIVSEYPYALSYFQFSFTGVPSGYDVSSGLYNAWSVQESEYIYVSTHYNVTFYSSYDPANPYPDDGNWPKVNYIINHKQGTVDDVQAAIWYFIDGQTMPTTQPGIDMVNDANANGASFVPAPGQLIAVVCWIGPTVMTSFIEVTIPPGSVVPEVPIGTVAASASMIIALFAYIATPRLKKN